MDLAEAASWAASKVSKLENGKQTRTAADLEAWCSACGAPGDARDLLVKLDEVHALPIEFPRRMRRGQATVQGHYNELVDQAPLVRHFEIAYVPGVLQIPQYARRVLTEMVDLRGVAIDDIDAAVAVRTCRQQALYDTTKRFEFLRAEPVLRWGLCPPSVMVAQLDRLATVVGMPNVRIGAIPLGVEIPTSPQNSFQLYDDLAVVETFVGETTHGRRDSRAYARVMDRLWDEAAVGDHARRLIQRAAGDLPQAT